MKNEPRFLYRAFVEEEYANQFVKEGKFRLGLLNYYKKVEDENRRDEAEGYSDVYIKSKLQRLWFNKQTLKYEGSDYINGDLHFGGTHMNSKYLLCTCGTEADLIYIRERFGEYVVKIKKPLMLLEEINGSKPICSVMEISDKCRLEKVIYTKGQKQKLDPWSEEAVKLSYLQKDPSFSDECEYRYIVMADFNHNLEPENYIYYDLNRGLDYLELI